MTSASTVPADRPVIRGRRAILHRALETFQVGGAGLALALAVALLAGELVSGGWLLIAPCRRPLVPALVFAATSVLWSALVAQAAGRARPTILPSAQRGTPPSLLRSS